MNFSKHLIIVILVLQAFAFALVPSVTVAGFMPQASPTAFNNRAPRFVSPSLGVAPFAVAVTCDLSIAKTVSPSSRVASGSTVTFTFTITDVGTASCGSPGAASPQTTVTDQLPLGLSAFAPVTAPSGWTCGVQNGGALVSCSASTSFQPNQPVTITVQATVTATSGTMTNCATADSAMDQNSGNNRSCVPITVAGGTPCDLQITKTVSPSSVQVGGTVTFTITVMNIGGAACTGPYVIVTAVNDPLPSGFSNPSGSGVGWGCTTSGLTVNCQTGSVISPSQSSGITIIATATTAGAYINCASVANAASTPPTGQSCVQVVISNSSGGSCFSMNLSTGQTNGVADAPGTVDSNWQFVSGPPVPSPNNNGVQNWLYANSGHGPAYSVSPAMAYATGVGGLGGGNYIVQYWMGGVHHPPDPNGWVGHSANWIYPYDGIVAVDDNAGDFWPAPLMAPKGTYVYSITFNIPATWTMPTTLVINGFIAETLFNPTPPGPVSSSAYLQLDGTNISGAIITGTLSSFNQDVWAGPFTVQITTSGQHVLTVTVVHIIDQNYFWSPTGLIIVASVQSAGPGPCTVVPIPEFPQTTAMTFMALTFAVVAIFSLRRRMRNQFT